MASSHQTCHYCCFHFDGAGGGGLHQYNLHSFAAYSSPRDDHNCGAFGNGVDTNNRNIHLGGHHFDTSRSGGNTHNRNLQSGAHQYNFHSFTGGGHHFDTFGKDSNTNNRNVHPGGDTNNYNLHSGLHQYNLHSFTANRSSSRWDGHHFDKFGKDSNTNNHNVHSGGSTNNWNIHSDSDSRCHGGAPQQQGTRLPHRLRAGTSVLAQSLPHNNHYY